MAEAIKEQRIVRDFVAIAERPDGSRVPSGPIPPPSSTKTGAITGAVNMLIDVTEEQSAVLLEQADRCRRLAGALYSRESNIVLRTMADGFERTAAGLKPDNDV